MFESYWRVSISNFFQKIKHEFSFSFLIEDYITLEKFKERILRHFHQIIKHEFPLFVIEYFLIISLTSEKSGT